MQGSQPVTSMDPSHARAPTCNQHGTQPCKGPNLQPAWTPCKGPNLQPAWTPAMQGSQPATSMGPMQGSRPATSMDPSHARVPTCNQHGPQPCKGPNLQPAWTPAMQRS